MSLGNVDVDNILTYSAINDLLNLSVFVNNALLVSTNAQFKKNMIKQLIIELIKSRTLYN